MKPSRRRDQGARTRAAILWFIARHHRAPSQREIARGVGRAPTTVAHHLERLRRAGRVDVAPRSVGTVRLLPVPGVEAVPVTWCARCAQRMPHDHPRHLPSEEPPR